MFMIAIFLGLIVGKRYNINQVPAHLRDYVLAELTALRLDGNGNPLSVEVPK